MQEYSRKATIAESRLEEIHKRSVHHDDHLRVVDAWLGQVLDEMELLVDAKVSTTSAASGKPHMIAPTHRVRTDCGCRPAVFE